MKLNALHARAGITPEVYRGSAWVAATRRERNRLRRGLSEPWDELLMAPDLVPAFDAFARWSVERGDVPFFDPGRRMLHGVPIYTDDGLAEGETVARQSGVEVARFTVPPFDRLEPLGLLPKRPAPGTA